MSRFGQGVPQGAHNQAAHHAGFPEPHFGFCRMDVDVNIGGIDFKKQREQRVSVAR